mmetsp:Transcript_36807/g.117144  ORF Transcript_36807/g.117144 Transcript_36807/m.117144 type:complete len:139 (-) Transcript_36807:304-720(-)
MGPAVLEVHPQWQTLERLDEDHFGERLEGDAGPLRQRCRSARCHHQSHGTGVLLAPRALRSGCRGCGRQGCRALCHSSLSRIKFPRVWVELRAFALRAGSQGGVKAKGNFWRKRSFGTRLKRRVWGRSGLRMKSNFGV